LIVNFNSEIDSFIRTRHLHISQLILQHFRASQLNNSFLKQNQ